MGVGVYKQGMGTETELELAFPELAPLAKVTLALSTKVWHWFPEK